MCTVYNNYVHSLKPQSVKSLMYSIATIQVKQQGPPSK